MFERFTFSETAYFWRWWKEQRAATRATFRSLVAEGRIQFAGGGWVQPDEATTDYLQLLDLYTWGLRFDTMLWLYYQIKHSWHIGQTFCICLRMYYNIIKLVINYKANFREEKSWKQSKTSMFTYRKYSNSIGSSWIIGVLEFL